MRSQDIYLGFTYDMVMFTQLHQTVANVLGVEAGPLVHQVRSLHAYERDIPTIDQLTWPPDEEPSIRLRGLEGACWDDVIDEAQYLALNTVPKEDEEFRTETEVWLNQQMAKVRAKVLSDA
jgi:thymidylate synthase